MTEDLIYLTVVEAGERIRNRTLSPVALVEACLDQIERFDSRLHSYLLVLADRARGQARTAESEIAAGRWRGPLHGIPFAVKDNYNTAGVRTCAASRLLLDHVPAHTATAITRLETAGAILLGKLNTWEFGTGTGAVDFDLPFEPARNPWNTDRFTGGSSSGAGAAVAAGMAMFALGTDTAGSIRLPAAGCGVVGLKPTFGLVSRAGILPNCWSLDIAGPLTRSAHDAALILGELAGYDEQDQGSVEVARADYRAELQMGVAGLRIGVLRDFGPDGPIASRAIQDGLEDMAAVLERLGAHVQDVAPPAPFHEFKQASSVINWAESYSIHEQDFLERRDLMGRALRDKMMTGFSVRAADYLAAQRQRRVLSRAMDDLVRNHDALLAPCTHQVAPSLTDPEAVIAFTSHAFTTPFSISGHPVMAVPTGFDTDRMPTSAQIIGRFFDEATTLRVAAAYERAADWSAWRPKLLPEIAR